MGPTQLNADAGEHQQPISSIQQQFNYSPSHSASHSGISSNTDSAPNSSSKPAQTSTSLTTSTSQDACAKEQRERDSDTPRPTSISTTIASTGDASTSSSRPTLPTMLCFCALTLSIFLVALDTVLIPTALPSISLDFHIPDSLYAWTGSAYLLANAASIPFWGKLSDVFGRKPIILISNGIFLMGSLVCAVSVNATMLVAGRTVQGLGGGGVNVLVYVCVADMFAIRYVPPRFCLGHWTLRTDHQKRPVVLHGHCGCHVCSSIGSWPRNRRCLCTKSELALVFLYQP